MQDSIEAKLKKLSERLSGIEKQLIEESSTLNQDDLISLNKEFSHIQPIVGLYSKYLKALDENTQAESLSKSDENEIQELAQAEMQETENLMNEILGELKLMLLPVDEDDERSAFLEIRAGAGGDEAGIFTGNLFRMYSRLAEREKWIIEIISQKDAEHGGFKEIIAKISGKLVYKTLKFESGVHRVQRVPETESQGRVHTSTCTVAVLPEAEEIDDVEIDKSEIRVDTFRASGAGGQHVNKTDSAVRITHLPSGLVVECQDGRSQHKNKTKALSLLSAKLKKEEEENQQAEIASERKILVGSGDRSEKIRTYNFPQGRVTDHRIKLTQHNLDQVMDGDIRSISDALIAENQLEMLAQLELDNK